MKWRQLLHLHITQLYVRDAVSFTATIIKLWLNTSAVNDFNEKRQYFLCNKNPPDTLVEV